MNRTWALGLIVAVVAAGLVWLIGAEYRQPCIDRAADNGLSGRAAVAACETGEGSLDDELTHSEFQGRLDDSLEELLRIIEQDGGL